MNLWWKHHQQYVRESINIKSESERIPGSNVQKWKKNPHIYLDIA